MQPFPNHQKGGDPGQSQVGEELEADAADVVETVADLQDLVAGSNEKLRFLPNLRNFEAHSYFQYASTGVWVSLMCRLCFR